MTTYREVFNEWLCDFDDGYITIKIGDTGRELTVPNSESFETLFPKEYEQEFCTWLARRQVFECGCGNQVDTLDIILAAYQGFEDEILCYDCIVSPAEQNAEEASRGLGMLGNA